MKLTLPAFALTYGLFATSMILQAQREACPSPISHITIGEGSMSPLPDVTFHLRHFAASLVPMGKVEPACYLKMTNVAHGEIFVSNASLTNVFAEKLDSSASKVKGFKVANGEGKVTLSGRITKVIPVEFSIEGPVTTDGRIISVDARRSRRTGFQSRRCSTL